MVNYDAMEYPGIELVKRANFEKKVKEVFGEYDNNTMYGDFLKNNLTSRGARLCEAKKERKQIKKKRFRNISIGALLTLIVISTFQNYFLPNIQKQNSIDYVTDNMVSEELIQINEEDIVVSVASFVKSLEEKRLSQDSALYYIKEIYGDDIFDLAVKSIGYADKDSYFIKKGYKDDVLSFSGNTVMETYSDEREYNDEMSEVLLEEVSNIKRGK